MGKLFILTVIDDIEHSDQLKVNPSTALLMEAMDDLHTTHGYALMHHWNLPEKYSRVVRDHHAETLEIRKLSVPHGAAGEQNLQQNGARAAARCRAGALATAEASELHLSEVDIAKLEIMLEDSQALGSKS